MSSADASTAFDVVIVGAGWSGLMAAKYCLAENLRTLVLEGSRSAGGVWANTDDTSRGGVMRNTRTTSSRCLTEISDFPMPNDYPDFPSHKEILAYLRSYRAHFRLDEHIKVDHAVVSVKKVDDVWRVCCKNGMRFSARGMIICCGTHQHPNDISGSPRFSGFSGSILHSAAVKEITPDYVGKSVVIWGGGESASDIADEASRVAAKVYWCIPNGQWFVPRVVARWAPFPSKRRKVVDHTTSRVRLLLSPTHQYSPLITQYFRILLGFNGHAQEPWRTHAPYNRSFFNKNSEVLNRVRSRHIIPKRDVANCVGERVSFTDGSVVDAQMIITCSGYHAVFPFLDSEVSQPADPRAWYKYTFYNADPSLAFVGFVRPIIGSIPGIAEMQSRYVSQVFAGKRRLAAPSERAAVITRDAAFWNHHFRLTSRRMGGLVDHYVFCKQLAKLIGCNPGYGKLLLKSPLKWWKAVSSPWNGCQFWLNDESQHERIFRTFDQYRDNQISEVYTFLLAAPVLPILGFCSYARVFLQERVLGRMTPPWNRMVATENDSREPASLPSDVETPLTQAMS